MNLHEYQAKQLLAEYGLPAPNGQVARNAEEAVSVADQLGGDSWIVKAQVHAGGRGKAGGVKFASSKDEVEEITRSLIGKNLVTFQTDDKGQPVNEVFIAQPCDIQSELYLGAVVDRETQRIVFMASTEGGVEIEEVAKETPEKIIRTTVDPVVGVQPYQAREMGFKLNLDKEQIKQFTKILTHLGRMFAERDLALLEINPLIIEDNGNLSCLDAKIVIDDNALYRQSALKNMRDPRQEDERENRAHDWQLNYVPLEGDIGCMVNGAGLAMATMDLVKLQGGNPANFLDVGGGATKERVTEAFKIILSDSHVKGILVNIFGGIVRCDMIADGIIGAVEEADVTVPVVVRLEGNQADVGAQKLQQSSLNITPAESLTHAATTIVEQVGKAS